MEIGGCTTNQYEIEATIKSSCLSGSYCPVSNCTYSGINGTVEGKIVLFHPYCPPGSVCATPTLIDKCPQYHFCPAGTAEPRPCIFAEWTCATSGLDIPNNDIMINSVLILGLIFVIFFAITYLYNSGCVIVKTICDNFPFFNKCKHDDKSVTNSCDSQENDSAEIILSLGMNTITPSSSFYNPNQSNQSFRDSFYSSRSWDLVRSVVRNSKTSWSYLLEQAKQKRNLYDKQEATCHNDIETAMYRVESSSSLSSKGDEKTSNESNSFRFKTITEPVHIRFKDLSMHLTGKTCAPILTDINGGIRAKRITGLMGPSGSGKTSLLALLRGQTYYATTGGTIMVNNKAYRDLIPFRNITSYVPQDDIMYDELTVEENLKFAAVLFNKRGYKTISEVMPMVKHTLSLLSITHISHSVVGSPERKGISGGQKKRVSIGMEMMKEASLFLLDEPTSGLDSASSISLLSALHKLTKQGVTIVATVHQPRLEILDLIDDLILLAPGGRLVYYGPTSEVEKYFSRNLRYTMLPGSNIADYVMDVMAGFVQKDFSTTRQTVCEIIDELCDHWKYEGTDNNGFLPKQKIHSSRQNIIEVHDEMCDQWKYGSQEIDITPVGGRMSAHVCHISGTTYHYHIPETKTIISDIWEYWIKFFKTLFMTFYRQLTIFIRTITIFQMDSLVLYVLGLMVALTYPTVLSQAPHMTLDAQISAMQLTFTQLVAEPGLRLFQDSLMRNRESESGLLLIPYYMGKCLGSLVETLLFPAIFLWTFYPLSLPAASFLDYYIMCLTLQMATYGFTNLISLFIPASNRTLMINGLLVLFWAFGGIIATEKTSRMGHLFYAMKVISPFRFSFHMNVLMEYRTYSPAYIQKALLPQLNRFGYGDYKQANDFLAVVDHQINEDIINTVVYSIATNLLALIYMLYSKDHFKCYNDIKRYWMNHIRTYVPTNKPEKIMDIEYDENKLASARTVDSMESSISDRKLLSPSAISVKMKRASLSLPSLNHLNTTSTSTAPSSPRRSHSPTLTEPSNMI